MYKTELQLDFFSIFKLFWGERMYIINNEYDDFTDLYVKNRLSVLYITPCFRYGRAWSATPRLEHGSAATGAASWASSTPAPSPPCPPPAASSWSPSGWTTGTSGRCMWTACACSRPTILWWRRPAAVRRTGVVRWPPPRSALWRTAPCPHSLSRYRIFFSVFCGSMKFWYGSADSYLWLMDSDPDPAIFVSDLQDVNKNSQFFSYCFLKVHLHHFSKIKSHRKVTKQVGINVFLTIFYWW